MEVFDVDAEPGAGAVVLGTSRSVRAPTFKGTETRAEVLMYLERLNAVIGAAGLHKQDKRLEGASTMVLGFKDEAYVWFNTYKEENPDEACAYATLRAAFEERFLPTLDRKDIEKLGQELIQRPDEQVANFMDRCVYFIIRMYDELDVDVKTSAAFKAVKEKQILDRFLQGMRPDIKAIVVQHSHETKDRKTFLSKARDAEISLTTARTKAAVAEITAVQQLGEEPKGAESNLDSHLDARIEAIMRRRWEDRPSPDARRGRNNGQNAAGQDRKKNAKCHFCKKTGHYIRECYALKRMEAQNGGQSPQRQGAYQSPQRQGAYGNYQGQPGGQQQIGRAHV